MSKYERLAEHLRSRHAAYVPMTFAEIERLLGFRLPPSSRRHRAWWSNNPSNNVMTRAWMEAGYRTEDVDLENERLIFRRLNEAPASGQAPEGSDRSKHHPLYGALRGLARVEKGHDLTEPADPEWGRM